MNGIGQPKIYSADQVVGKTLFAVVNIPIKRIASASAPVVYTAAPGTAVGRVYSWVMDGPTLYWQFYDANGKAYYAKHQTGIFSVEALQQQGAMTIEEIKQAADEQNKPWYEQLFGGNGIGGTVKTAIWVLAGFLIYKQLSK